MYTSLSGIVGYSRQLREFQRAFAREQIEAAIERSRGCAARSAQRRERDQVFGLLCVRCSWQAESFDRQACRECGSELERRLLEPARLGR